MSSLEERFPPEVIIDPHRLRDRWEDQRTRRDVLRHYQMRLWQVSWVVLLIPLGVLALLGKAGDELDVMVLYVVSMLAATGVAAQILAPRLFWNRVCAEAGGAMVAEMSTQVMTARCLVDDGEAGEALRRHVGLTGEQYEVVQTLVGDGFDGSAEEVLQAARALTCTS